MSNLEIYFPETTPTILKICSYVHSAGMTIKNRFAGIFLAELPKGL